MKEIRVDDSTYERLGNHAQPFETEDEVINRALDALDQQADSPALTTVSGTDSERWIDPLRLPDMMFTKVLDATIQGKMVTRPNWNRLLLTMVRLAHAHTRNFEELTRLFPTINLVRGQKVDQGYRYLSDIGVSVQGQPANSACTSVVMTAQQLGIALDIGFMWRDKEDAAHPGDRARIQTTGSTSPDSLLEDRTEELQEPRKEILFLQGPRDSGITARGYRDGRNFIVLSGSKAAKKEARSIRNTTSNYRKELLKRGLFEDDGPRYRLVQNHRFNSPSAASSTLLGRESNGRTEWKDTTGRPLKEIQEDIWRSAAR